MGRRGRTACLVTPDWKFETNSVGAGERRVNMIDEVRKQRTKVQVYSGSATAIVSLKAGNMMRSFASAVFKLII